MDANTRHQLKQNELAEALAKLRSMNDPRFLWGLVIVGAAVCVVLGWYAYRYTRQNALERDWAQLGRLMVGVAAEDPATAQAAQGELAAAIQEWSDPTLRGYGQLQLARAKVDQAYLNPGARQAALGEAAEMLNKIRSAPDTDAALHAAATFLLATTYESLRDFEGAKSLYQSLVDGPRYAGSPFQRLATDRLKDIDKLSDAIAFLPGSPPPPAPPPGGATPPGSPPTPPSAVGPQGQPLKPVPMDPTLLNPTPPSAPPPTPPAAGSAGAQPAAPPPVEQPKPAQPAEQSPPSEQKPTELPPSDSSGSP